VTRRVKVVYIAGSGRSGTTIVDNVLGELTGWFSAGELRFVWDRNVRDDWACGCGEPFSRCQLWQDVLRVAYAATPPDAADVLAWREQSLRLRMAPLVRTPGARKRVAARGARYLDVLQRLYQAIAEVSGARVIVDSSKYPSYGYLLSLADDIDVTMVHLVRDPRAVAYSWTRRKLEMTTSGIQAPMGQVAPIRTAADWLIWAALAEQYGRALPTPAMRVRYEDFVDRPEEVVGSIVRHAGLPAQPTPFLANGGARLSGNHTVGGNPVRLRQGDVSLRVDDEWMAAMPRHDRWAVTGLAWPGMVAYGYGSAGGAR
jgi:hypothetical protein